MKMRTAALKRSTSNVPSSRLELHQVQRGEIARGVVEEHVFASTDWSSECGRCLCRCATSGWSYRTACRDRRKSRCLRRSCAAACAASFFSQRLAVGDALRPPFLPVHRRLHELIADADGEIFVLIHHAAVGIAVVRSRRSPARSAPTPSSLPSAWRR